MNLLTYFQPQLDEIIADKLGETCPPSCLFEPLNNVHEWHRDIAYRSMKLRFNQSYLTLSDWISLHGLIEGDYRPFNTRLIVQLKATIEKQWEIKQKLGQEDLINEITKAAEVVNKELQTA